MPSAVQRFTRMRLGGFQQTGQIQFLLLRRKTVQLFQQVGAANQIHQTFYAQLRHQLAGFTGDKFKVVGHFERQAVIVVLTQFVILSCDAGGAVVQVANTQVFTAQRDHRTGAEAETFGAQDRGLNDVEAGFQAAVHLQADFMTQTVRHQCLLGFHQTQFPRTPGVFHRRERACAGAAIVARDGNQVRIGFRDAGCDGADARFGNQLHGNHRLRVNLLEVENQLRQIFNRVDIVMRRRRNQRHARYGIAQFGDIRGDFVARQLAAFARLRALGHFNLDHIGIDQVRRGNAEATRCHLLNTRHFIGAVTRRIFAAFAGVGIAADAVHGFRQRFVGFRAQRADRHRRRIKAFEQVGGWFNLINADRFTLRV